MQGANAAATTSHEVADVAAAGRQRRGPGAALLSIGGDGGVQEAAA